MKNKHPNCHLLLVFRELTLSMNSALKYITSQRSFQFAPVDTRNKTFDTIERHVCLVNCSSNVCDVTLPVTMHVD
jgi:hypothetical protein